MSAPHWRRLAWDTDFLGFGTAELTAPGLPVAALRPLLAAAREQGIRLLYWSVAPTDAVAVASAGQLGGFLADEKVTYALTPPAAPPPAWPPRVQPLHQLSPAIAELAQQSGAFSRFRLDPGFAPGVFEELYARWIAGAVAGTDGQQAFGYQVEAESDPAGLLTLAYAADQATIGLLAVQAQRRGTGFGRQLIQAASFQAVQRGLPTLRVVTQAANAAACAFYVQCGFTEASRRLLYHLWL
jgi:dTDP-4-amino-4,6-dideoxy-D-galactose acyltransferase